MNLLVCELQLQKLQEFKKRVDLLKKNSLIKKEIQNNQDEIIKLKQKQDKLFKCFQNFQQIIQQINKEILSHIPKKVNQNQILEYNSIISPYLTFPNNYEKADQFLPWSYGMNKIQNFEIEASSLYFKYKNNPTYKKLDLPQIEYTNNTEQNVNSQKMIKEGKALLSVKNHVYIKLVSPEVVVFDRKEKTHVIYTLDNTNPTRLNFNKEQQEILFFKENAILKFRSVFQGFIESDIFELNIQIEENQQNNYFTNEIERPELEFSQEENQLENSNLSIEDEIFQNENFASWHNYNNIQSNE